jgi:YfiH family protein
VSVLTSSVLGQLSWVEHGFGTRESNPDQTAMARVNQIHSAEVRLANAVGNVGEGDALVTRQPGLAISIRTADCFPILLADPVTRSVAAVHAGWRGTAASVVLSSLSRMKDEFGTSPHDVYAAIGPGIGPCCYEVGLDVAQRFGKGEAGRLDLAAENRAQLIDAGLRPDRIDAIAGCTFCNPAQFFSWRRDHDRAGRMISFIRVGRNAQIAAR